MHIQQFISAIDEAFRDTDRSCHPGQLAAEIAPTDVRIAVDLGGYYRELEISEVVAKGCDVVVIVKEN